MDARITITTNEEGLCAIQKGFTGSFNVDQIKKAVETARIKGQEVREKLRGVSK
jgi:exosome complex component RRP42